MLWKLAPAPRTAARIKLMGIVLFLLPSRLATLLATDVIALTSARVHLNACLGIILIFCFRNTYYEFRVTK
uniref:Putative secreted protein n=1 Tax=Ixodes ricinus TaxID=34613 RepID=A0A6B0U0K3_IXORI